MECLLHNIANEMGMKLAASINPQQAQGARQVMLAGCHGNPDTPLSLQVKQAYPVTYR
jgi:hypothetical protein